MLIFSIPALADWEYTYQTDPINDRKAEYVRNDIVTGKIEVICETRPSGKSSLAIQAGFGSYANLGDQAFREMIYRLDSDDPKTLDGWMLMRQSNVLYLSIDEKVKEFLADMRRGNKIVLRIKGNSFAKIYTSSFSLAGLEEKLPKMECFQ